MSQRRLIIMDKLPAAPEGAIRFATLRMDMMDLSAKMRAALTEKANAFTVSGWSIVEDSMTISQVPDSRTLVATVLLERAD